MPANGTQGLFLEEFLKIFFFLVLFRVIGLKRSNSVGLLIMKGGYVELCGWIAGKMRELGLYVKKLCLRMDWWGPKEDLQESVCSCPMSEAKDLLSGKNLGQT